MSKNTSIILSGDLENFVQSQIESGYYGSVSDVIRAGLRLLEEQSVKLAKLREELSKGETGEGVFISDYKAQLTAMRLVLHFLSFATAPTGSPETGVVKALHS